MAQLSRIIHDAQRIIDCISHALEISPSQSTANVLQHLTSPPTAQKLNLPCAENYLALIKHQPLSTDIVEHCRGVLSDLAQRTHETYNRTVREAISSSPPGAELSGTINAFCRVLEKHCHQQSVQLMQLVDKYHTKKLASQKYVSVAKNSKSTFNHKYTPLLEQYFERNAYPSGSNKASLAKRTGMTQRQIDVWFQNHRTRAKRDGRPLRRPLDESFSAPLAANILNINKATFPQQVYSVASSDTEIEESDNDLQVFPGGYKERCHTILDPFGSQTPSYAFPALYRQREKQDPIIIPSPTWERNPSAHKRTYEPIDMDELVSSFASKLTLRTGDSNIPRRSRPEQGTSDRRKAPWFESRITVPAAAPLTALVHSQNPRLRNRCPSMRRTPHPYGTRWTSTAELGLKPSHCLRPGDKNNQRRRSSSSSTSSYSSSGSSEDLSSGNELLTPPTSPLIPPQFIAEKTIPFDIHGPQGMTTVN